MAKVGVRLQSSRPVALDSYEPIRARGSQFHGGRVCVVGLIGRQDSERGTLEERTVRRAEAEAHRAIPVGFDRYDRSQGGSAGRTSGGFQYRPVGCHDVGGPDRGSVGKAETLGKVESARSVTCPTPGFGQIRPKPAVRPLCHEGSEN